MTALNSVLFVPCLLQFFKAVLALGAVRHTWEIQYISPQSRGCESLQHINHSVPASSIKPYLIPGHLWLDLCYLLPWHNTGCNVCFISGRKANPFSDNLTGGCVCWRPWPARRTDRLPNGSESPLSANATPAKSAFCSGVLGSRPSVPLAKWRTDDAWPCIS